GSVEQFDRLLDLAVLHPRPRLTGELTDFELSDAGRQNGGLRVFVLRDCLFVLVRLGQRLRPREQRVDAAALVCRDTPLEESGIDAELDGEPLDRLARGPGFAALDLADVLLRET